MTDQYYMKAKVSNRRARSYYKLEQIFQNYPELDVTRYSRITSQSYYGEFQDRLIVAQKEYAIDLCCCPGSWSQFLASKSFTKIIAVDLNQMQPIGNVVFIQGDITSARTQKEISFNMDQSKASLIVCDGAPPNQGIFNTTYFMQNKLLDSCLQVVNALIKDGGHFVSKIFIDDQKDIFYSQFILDKFKPFFSDVEIYKPDSSRNSSNENFVICRKFRSRV